MKTFVSVLRKPVGRARSSPSPDFCEQSDAKDYVLSLIESGGLLLGPLRERMKKVLEQMGFQNVRVDHELIHDVYLVRAGIGTNTACVSEQIARGYFRRMAKRVGKRCQPGGLQPSIEQGQVRCGIHFHGLLVARTQSCRI
jgi:hypothetical protein